MGYVLEQFVEVGREEEIFLSPLLVQLLWYEVCDWCPYYSWDLSLLVPGASSG
jgi:hypothetical protein